MTLRNVVSEKEPAIAEPIRLTKTPMTTHGVDLIDVGDGSGVFDSVGTTHGVDLIDVGDGFGVFDSVGTTHGVDLIDVGDGFGVFDSVGGGTLLGGANLNGVVYTGPKVLDPYPENDTIYGTAGNDRIDGGDGDDLVSGMAGDDVIFGGAGDDILVGGSGLDHLMGGEGHDWLNGYDGIDYLDGGAGNDRMLGDDGGDMLWGGAGNDELDGGDGMDTLFGGDDDDILHGWNGADTLFGGAGNDILYGDTRFGSNIFPDGTGDNNAADLLFGEDGDDRLYGGGGADQLDGGTGSDTLTGGAGRDVFTLVDRPWQAPEYFELDVITDFEAHGPDGTSFLGDWVDLRVMFNQHTDFTGTNADQAFAQGYLYFLQHGTPGQSGFGTTVYIDRNGSAPDVPTYYEPHDIAVVDLQGVALDQLGGIGSEFYGYSKHFLV